MGGGEDNDLLPKEILIPPALFVKANSEQTHVALGFDFYTGKRFS